MRQFAGLFGCLLLTHLAHAADDADALRGEWRTTLGVVKLDPQGEEVTATFVGPGLPPVKGQRKQKTLTFAYREGRIRGDATLTLDDGGRSFTGWFQYEGGPRQPWNGWRPDPTATKGSPGRFAGLWLTELGLMELEEDGAKVKGRFALRGTSDIEGDLTGRRLEFRYRAFLGGHGWFDLAADGSTLAGAAVDDGSRSWFGWRGRKAPELARQARLAPGRVVAGSTANLLTYAVRAPEGYKEGAKAKWPAVVVLHGSNMNGASYVATLASAWPDVARDFILLGINGERPSDVGPDPRFNYTYINYVGRSTFKGFPGTDRESPAVVHEALDELKGVYPIAHYLVGGHSQGGFLTYSLLMNFPESLAGAFPVSCGVIFQCEPSAYDDQALRAAQRAVPLAIVHGKTDPLVDFGMGRYAADLFGEAGWPAFRFFADDAGGHMFARLPVGAAIRWLEALASDDPDRLLDFAARRQEEGAPRDAVAALRRARGLKLTSAQRSRAERIGRDLDARAKAGAAKFLGKIRDDPSGRWIDDFLAYRDAFEFADGAREVMAAFDRLRREHEAPAKAAFDAARQAFQQGRRDEGYAKYQEIVDKDYASPLYRIVKRSLAERR